jgi:TolB-like protein
MGPVKVTVGHGTGDPVFWVLNLSGDPEQDYFADGMVEDIISALSRLRWLFVIARNSSFTYKGRAAADRRPGGEAVTTPGAGRAGSTRRARSRS